jgi:hypothetical protein
MRGFGISAKALTTTQPRRLSAHNAVESQPTGAVRALRFVLFEKQIW